jgi:phospholipase/lecithinase/hemolysin
MTFQRLRRALLGAACLSGALLAACGGGEVESKLAPKRLVSFGDAFSDLGQAGPRYTINDGTTNIWSQQLAARYGLSLSASSAGGSSYATASARVAAKPDAAGNAATPTVTEQVDRFLAGASFNADDLVLINGGVADIVAEVGQTRSGAQSSSQAAADIEQAGKDLGAQVRRLVQAGASHVVVVGAYNLGRSPWARNIGQAAQLEDYATRFNNALLVSIVDLGANALYVDAALYYNLVIANPATYGLVNPNESACAVNDPGPGIGIGNGEINSALCTPENLRGPINRDQWLWADPVYPTPIGHRLFGDYAYDRITRRW